MKGTPPSPYLKDSPPRVRDRLLLRSAGAEAPLVFGVSSGIGTFA